MPEAVVYQPYLHNFRGSSPRSSEWQSQAGCKHVKVEGHVPNFLLACLLVKTSKLVPTSMSDHGGIKTGMDDLVLVNTNQTHTLPRGGDLFLLLVSQ